MLSTTPEPIADTHVMPSSSALLSPLVGSPIASATWLIAPVWDLSASASAFFLFGARRPTRFAGCLS